MESLHQPGSIQPICQGFCLYMKGLLRRPPRTRLQGAHFFEINRLHVIMNACFFHGWREFDASVLWKSPIF